MNAIGFTIGPQRLRVTAAFINARKRRRRRGVIWAIVAATALFSSWDIASRLDDGIYGASLYQAVIR